MKHPIRTLVAASLLAVVTSHVAFAAETENAAIKESLDMANITAPMLQVSVENGVATLTGTVEDRIQKEKIVEAVKHTQGVKEVRDNIEIDG